MTSLPDVPTIVGLRSRHTRDPAPAEEPTTNRPERMLARTMPVTRMALARILRTRLIAPSVRRLGREPNARAGTDASGADQPCRDRASQRPAFAIEAAPYGAETFANPEGSPRFRSVTRVARSPASSHIDRHPTDA